MCRVGASGAVLSKVLSCPSGAVEIAIVDSLTDVCYRDVVAVVEVGNRTGYFQYPVVGASREIKACHSRFESLQPLLVGYGKPVEQAGVHLCIAIHAGNVGKAFGLPLAGLYDSGSYVAARLGGSGR